MAYIPLGETHTLNLMHLLSFLAGTLEGGREGASGSASSPFTVNAKPTCSP